jgi:hypothetical protein
MKFHHFSTRERLQHANGRSDNHVMWSGAGQGTSDANDLYPSFSSPRLVAGGPLANDIVKCQLKRIDFDDYTVTFNADQRRQLRRIFPDGVCDWEPPGVEQRPLRGLWLSFGPSPVNRIEEAD